MDGFYYFGCLPKPDIIVSNPRISTVDLNVSFLGIYRIHNGRNVIEGQHCTASLDENGLATLTIHAVKCEDGGLYSAIASNKHGKVTSEAPVIGKIRIYRDIALQI